MSGYENINDGLMSLLYEIVELEENAIITEEFQDITNNDMHIIEAVGLGEGRNMSSIARKLNITVGALTIAMNSLVRKKYVLRERCESDRRVVNIRLTEKGLKAFAHHEEFHKRMDEAVMADLKEEEVDVIVTTLHRLSSFLKSFELV